MNILLVMLIAVLAVVVTSAAYANNGTETPADRVERLESKIVTLQERVEFLEDRKDLPNANVTDLEMRIERLLAPIEAKQAIIDRLGNATETPVNMTSTTDQSMASFHARLNTLVIEVHAIIAKIAIMQVELVRFILFEPDPITIPETEAQDNTLLLITVNGTEFGLGDVMEITVTPGTLANEGPPRLDGTSPTLRSEEFTISISGEVTRDNCSISIYPPSDTSGTGNMEFHRIHNGTHLTCMINDDGTIIGIHPVHGGLHAGLHVVHVQYIISWSNYRAYDDAESSQFIIR